MDGNCYLNKYFPPSLSQSISSDRGDDAIAKYPVLDILPFSLVKKMISFFDECCAILVWYSDQRKFHHTRLWSLHTCAKSNWKMTNNSQYCCLKLIWHTLHLVLHSGLGEATSKINNVLANCDSLMAALHKLCRTMELLEAEASIQIPSSNNSR